MGCTIYITNITLHKFIKIIHDQFLFTTVLIFLNKVRILSKVPVAPGRFSNGICSLIPLAHFSASGSDSFLLAIGETIGVPRLMQIEFDLDGVEDCGVTGGVPGGSGGRSSGSGVGGTGGINLAWMPSGGGLWGDVMEGLSAALLSPDCDSCIVNCRCSSSFCFSRSSRLPPGVPGATQKTNNAIFTNIYKFQFL